MVDGAEVGKGTSCTSTEIGFLASQAAGSSTSVIGMEMLDIGVGDMQMRHLTVSLRLGEHYTVGVE